jgi:hypothetical protein
MMHKTGSKATPIFLPSIGCAALWIATTSEFLLRIAEPECPLSVETLWAKSKGRDEEEIRSSTAP